MPLRLRAALALLSLLPALAGGAGGVPGAAPRFPAGQRAAVLARAGDSAELACRVLRLADRAVSWVRSSDLQILSHAGAVFTADSRVSCLERDSDTDTDYDTDTDTDTDADPDADADTAKGPVSLHVLRIARVRASDAGRYECQVNTEPKMSLFFNLSVVDGPLPRAVVRAARGAVRGARGGAARLACSAHYEPPLDGSTAGAAALPPLRISWRHNGRDIDSQSVRGGVSLEAERWGGGAASRLTLAALTARDAGAYTCSAAGAADTVRLEVLDQTNQIEEEPVGEMQRDEAAARSGAAWATLSALGALAAALGARAAA